VQEREELRCRSNHPAASAEVSHSPKALNIFLSWHGEAMLLGMPEENLRKMTGFEEKTRKKAS
jgi:hypothetical protein